MDISYYKKYEPIDGKWYITKELGSGSFGTVFEIQRKDFPEMKSALKIISIPNSQNEVRSYREENYDLDDKSVTSFFYGFVEEFIKEFKLMSQLKGNSNIVSYEDHDIKKHENGIGWDILIRMELLTPLGKYLADNKPDQNTVIKLGIDMCKALEVCQKNNIIHRDIKPSNIFVSDNGDFKLGDFGVARTLEKTSSGLSKKGTYTYMAPEVFKGEAYGASVDTYSLGIVMYKLLNNNLEPFRTDRTFNNGERAIELRMSGANMAKPQNADEELAAVILKACSFNPGERYQNPSEMKKRLESILKEKMIDGQFIQKEDDIHHNLQDNSERTLKDNMLDTLIDEQETVDEDNKTISMFMEQNESDKVLQQQLTTLAKNKMMESNKQKENSTSNFTNKISAMVGHTKNLIVEKWKICVPIITLVLAVVIGMVFYSNLDLSDSDGTKVELYPTTSVGNSDLKNIEKNIKARLKILNGKTNAKLEDNKVIVSFSDEVLTQDPTTRKQILNWTKTKGNISIYSNVNYEKSSFGKESFEDIKIVELSKDNLSKYEKYFNENDYNNLKNSGEDVLYAISVKLNDSAKVYYDQMLSAVNDNFKTYEAYNDATIKYEYTSLQLAMDKEEYESTMAVGTILPDDKSGDHTFLIVSPAAYNSKVTDLMQYVLNEKNELPSKLTEKVVSVPNWEKDTAEFGDNQVAELDGKNIIIKFTPNEYVVDSYTQNDINQYMSIVKKRLDTLGSPYMVGYTGIDYKTILVKIPPSRLIANSCAMLMREKSIVINNQYKQLDTGVKNLTIDGTQKITAQMAGDKNRIMSEYNKTSWELIGERLDDIETSLNEIDGETSEENNNNNVPQQESGLLYLLVNDVTIAQADLSEMSEEGVVEFSKFLCFENNYCSAEASYMFDLIQQINSEAAENDDSMLQGSLDVLYYDGEKEIKNEKVDWLYDSMNDYDRQTIRTIEKLGYKVEASLTARSTLEVYIDVEINDDMPAKFADAVKKIYTKCNFDDGSYSTVFFLIVNEYDRYPNDRCRIVADKSSLGSKDDNGKLAVRFIGCVDGPTFEKYRPDFDKITKQDEFFSSRFDG